MDRNQARERARDIVLAVWRRVDKSGWSKQRLYGIYDELSGKIQSAALTSDLVKFTENLARKFGVRSLDDRALLDLIRVLSDEDHRQVLDALRSETSFVVLMIRVASEEARDRFEKRQAEAAADAAGLGGAA